MGGFSRTHIPYIIKGHHYSIEAGCRGSKQRRRRAREDEVLVQGIKVKKMRERKLVLWE